MLTTILTIKYQPIPKDRNYISACFEENRKRNDFTIKESKDKTLNIYVLRVLIRFVFK